MTNLSLPRFAIYSDWDSRASVGGLEQEIKRSLPKAQIEYVSRIDILNPALYENLNAFLLPGIVGEESLYHDHVGPANDLIRAYIQRGGVFIGQCAGANYAARNVRFQPHWAPHKTRDEGLLALFNGIAFGPPEGLGVDGNDPRYFRGLTTARIVTDAIEFAMEFPVAYSSGPTFVPNEGQDFRTHARYVDVPGQPPAVISFDYGRGLVILTGPVPQYSPRHAISIKDAAAQMVVETLQAFEPERIRFFDSLMYMAVGHTRSTGFLNRPVL